MLNNEPAEGDASQLLWFKRWFHPIGGVNYSMRTVYTEELIQI